MRKRHALCHRDVLTSEESENLDSGSYSSPKSNVSPERSAVFKEFRTVVAGDDGEHTLVPGEGGSSMASTRLLVSPIRSTGPSVGEGIGVSGNSWSRPAMMMSIEEVFKRQPLRLLRLMAASSSSSFRSSSLSR